MTGLPAGMKVEVEFVAGTWTDVTADVDASTGINLKFGRTSEFSAPQTATCDLTLDDSAGKYTALNASSPYYPNIRPRRRIRVSNAYGPRFVGYIKGWPPGFDGNRRVVHITASDRMSLLARQTLGNVVDTAIKATPPTWYFPMNDTGSDTAGGLWLREYQNAITAPFAASGVMTNAHVAGGTTPPSGSWDTPWVQFTPDNPGAGGDGGWNAMIGNQTQGARLAGSVFTILVAYQNTSASYAASGSTSQILWAQDDTSGNQASLNMYDTGAYLSFYYPTAASTSYVTVAMPIDTKPHVIRVVGYRLGVGVGVYVDGVLAGTSGGIAALSPGRGAYIGMASAVLSSPYLYGAMAHLAIWQGSAVYGTYDVETAILSGFSGETSGTTVTRLLTQGGLLVGDMNVAAGQAVMGPYQQQGKTIDTALQDVATTEGGGAVVFVDTDGRVRFNDRTYRNATTPAMTLDAVLDLDGTNFVPSYDELTLVNTSTVTNNTTGAVISYTDPVSLAEFGSTTDQVTAYSRDDQAAQNLAQDRVSRQSEPALRVSQLTVDFFTAIGTATYTALAGVTIGSRVRVTNIPTTVTGPSGTAVVFPFSQMDSYVEGWTETIAIDQYTVVFDTSPADNPARMLWSDAVYGRWQADPGSMTLQASITATATTAQVATNAGSPLLTTNAGDLPMLMVIDTEVINVTAVSGSSSPQTITFTRGANGTLATAHAGGAVVNVYPTADWTL